MTTNGAYMELLLILFLVLWFALGFAGAVRAVLCTIAFIGVACLFGAALLFSGRG